MDGKPENEIRKLIMIKFRNLIWQKKPACENGNEDKEYEEIKFLIFAWANSKFPKPRNEFFRVML